MNGFARIASSLGVVALTLTGYTVSGQELSRGPYLQSPTQTSVVVRWRTMTPSDSRVRFGTSPGSLTSMVDDPALVTEHEVSVTGLVAGTRYYYSVGSVTTTLAGDDADHHFVTSRQFVGDEPVRIWVVGDSGTAHQRQPIPGIGEIRDAQGVRDAFLAHAGLGQTLVVAGATWKYLDDGSDQGTAWRDPGFADGTWASGPGELGYGDGSEPTVVNCGPSAPACNVDNFITTYFRHEFDVDDASDFASVTLSLLRDDGAVAYLNGSEVFRSNLPAGAIDFSTTASPGVGGSAELIFHRVPVDPALLVDGSNLLAVEIHQGAPTSSDISFHAELFGETGAGLRTDLWLMAGDNAYNNGTDDEWQQAVFDPFAIVLRNTPVWPVLGNHDITTMDGAPQLEAMTLPTAGEAGGLASGTEEYYSFDHANIHFVALDSTHAASRQPGSAMLTWLAADLAATVQEWVVAIWHHPPYSKGSHDSDNPTPPGGEGILQEMRENILPILEAGGVDLVLTGHSHSYERSMLIDGFYATPTTIGDGTVLDSGSGDPFDTGPYEKNVGVNEGTVYSVVGSSGRNANQGSLAHPVTSFAIHDLGSLVLEVYPNRLDGAFLNRDCAALQDPACELETFSIVKGTASPGYIRLVTTKATVPHGTGLTFRIEIENITALPQNLGLGLFLLPPGSPSVQLAAQPLVMPPHTAIGTDLALPISAGLPSGTWQMLALLVDGGGTTLDTGSITFEVP